MRQYQILSVLLLALMFVVSACAQKGAQASGQQPQRDNRPVSAQPVVNGDPDTPPVKTADVAKDRITIQQLKEKMDANEEVIILDVRSKYAWESSSIKIKGAIRVDPEQVEAGTKSLPKDKLIVAYCT